MGALPKRKLSSGRRDRRRAQAFKMRLYQVIACPECGEPVRPYHVCPHCGKYRGKQVIEVKD